MCTNPLSKNHWTTEEMNTDSENSKNKHQSQKPKIEGVLDAQKETHHNR